MGELDMAVKGSISFRMARSSWLDLAGQGYIEQSVQAVTSS